MRTIRYMLWAAVFVAAAAAGWLSLSRFSDDGGVKLGGEFQLVRTDGSAFRSEEMNGRPHLLFFGFTHCPEICPTTLFEATAWLQDLGPDGDKLDVYFISVDPERDTPDFLATYLTAFDPRIIGLTGTLEEMDKAAKAYHVFYRRVPTDDGSYTMDHTASVFLIKADGTFSGTVAWQENPEVALGKIRRLIDG